MRSAALSFTIAAQRSAAVVETGLYTAVAARRRWADLIPVTARPAQPELRAYSQYIVW